MMSMVKDLVRYEKQHHASLSNSSEAKFGTYSKLTHIII